MKILSLLIFGFTSFLSITGCDKNKPDMLAVNPQSEKFSKTEDASGVNCIYSNSFESDADTAGWVGVIPEMLVKDPGPDGGIRSLLVGGGCIQPIAYRSIKITKDGYYKISFWGKTDNQGGFINFSVESKNYTSKQSIQVNSRDWTHYEITKFYCPADNIIKLEMFVGGIVFASANIDELKILSAGNLKPIKLTDK